MSNLPPHPTHASATCVRRLTDRGPLQAMLLDACPPNAEGAVSIVILSEAMKLSNWAVYRWIETGRVPANRARQLVDVSEGRITLDRVLPFVIGA